jgi:hypothetical protein
MDSQAKVTMRSKVRGLRAIERRVLAERRQAVAPQSPPPLCCPRALPRLTPPPRHRPRQPKRLRRSPVYRALGDWSRPRAPLRGRVWPQMRNRKSRTRRERWCSVIVRRCAACSTRARVVHCTPPVYG